MFSEQVLWMNVSVCDHNIESMTQLQPGEDWTQTVRHYSMYFVIQMNKEYFELNGQINLGNIKNNTICCYTNSILHSLNFKQYFDQTIYDIEN